MGIGPNRPVKTVETASAVLAAIKSEGWFTLPELTAELGLAKSMFTDTSKRLNISIRPYETGRTIGSAFDYLTSVCALRTIASCIIPGCQS